MSVEFGASIKLDSRSALDQMRKFANASTEASRTLRQLQNETRATAQGLGGNIFRKYIDATRKVSVQTERAVAKIHDQSKALSKLNESERALIATVDKLNQKYDDSARAEASLTKVRRELRLVTAAGLKTQKEADAIYKKESVAIQKSTTAYKQRQAVLKREADLQSSQKRRLSEIQAKYNHVYAAEMKERQLRKELNLLRRKQIITDAQYTKILARQTKRIKEQTAHTIKLTSAQSRLAKTARLVSIYSRVLLGLYAGARLTTFIKDMEVTAEKIGLLQDKLEYLTGDSGAYKKLFDMTQDVGIKMEAANKIITRFAVVTNRAFDIETMNEWSSTLVKSARATGTSTQEMSGALIQITQAMSAGRLMGDEYRSVTENLPLLTVALRDLFKDSTMSLKELSSEGLITNEVMIEAFGGLKELLEGFPDSTKTIEAAFGRLSSAWDNFIAKAMKTDFSKSIANNLTRWLNNYSDSLETDRLNENTKKLKAASDKLRSAEAAALSAETKLSKLNAQQEETKNNFRLHVINERITTEESRLAKANKDKTDAERELRVLTGNTPEDRRKRAAEEAADEERRLTAIYKEQLKVIELIEKVNKGKTVKSVDKRFDLLRNDVESKHDTYSKGKVGLNDKEFFAAYDKVDKAHKDAVQKVLQTQVDASLRMRGFKTKFDLDDIEKELSHNAKILEIKKKHADRVLQVQSAVEAGKEEARLGVSPELRQGISKAKGDELIGGLDAKKGKLINDEIVSITNSINSMTVAAERASMVIKKDAFGLLSMEQSAIVEKHNKSLESLDEHYKKLGDLSMEQAFKYEIEKAVLRELRDLETENAERKFNEALEDKFSAQTVALRKYVDSIRDLANAKARMVVSDQEHAYQLRLINEEYDHQVRLAQSLSGELSTLDQVYGGLEQGAINFMNNTESAYEFFTSSTEELMDASIGLMIDHSDSAREAFNRMVRSMLVDLQKLAIKRAIIGAFGNIGGSTVSSYSSTSVPSYTNTTPNVGLDTTGFSLSAKGNVFSGAGISAYSNKIVDKPTFFADGGNIMGEAGPEAIMPLKRGSNGKLGVQGAGGGVSIVINNNSSAVVETNTTKDKNGKDIVTFMVHEAISEMVQNGRFDTMMTPYNITRKGVR